MFSAEGERVSPGKNKFPPSGEVPLNDYGDMQTAVEASLVNAEKHNCTRQI